MKFEVFQDEEGNIYKLTTEVEQLMSEALLEQYNKIEEAKEYITKNFTNQDGTIWHSEMQDIYNILNDKDN
jgi:hypothetical protein